MKILSLRPKFKIPNCEDICGKPLRWRQIARLQALSSINVFGINIGVKIEYLCTPDSWCSVGNSMTSLRPDSATLQIADDK